MLGNKRIVALCTCRIQDKESNRFISKLENVLNEIDCTMIIYNCCSCTPEGGEDNDAQLFVFDLIDISYIDAVILQADRFCNINVCRKIADSVLSKNLPVVVLGEVFEECLSITYRHQSGFAEIVSHLIKCHGITDMHMIAGNKGNIYSEERIETFKSILEENNIPFDENMISYGDFWPIPAQEAVKKLIDENRLPEALVCANDNMAVAAVNVLKEHGISVPDRVAVTGFDCIDAIYSSEPTITSAYISPEVTVQAVVNALVDIFSGKRRKGSVILHSSMVANESCGCPSSFKTNATMACSEQYSNFCVFQDENIELSVNCAKIQKCTDFRQIVSIMDESGLMNSMSCFLMAECTDEKTDWNSISIKSIGDNFFLLYDSDWYTMKKSEGDFEPHFISFNDLAAGLKYYSINGYSVIISSLYYLDVPMGFVCFHFKERLFSNYSRIPQIVTALNNALGGMINLRHTRYLIRQIDEMYRNDPLTGLYNRRGFCIEYDKFFECNKDKSLSVVMGDLDGLKGINDNYGHEAGDIAIQTFANALKYAGGNDAICTRMGGDEMLVVYVCESGRDEIFCHKVESYLDNFNKTSGKDYTVNASMGTFHTEPGKKLSFEELIKCSDPLMYKNKKRRKNLS